MKTHIFPSHIKIDKEGIWYYRDEEIIRKEIICYFYQNLKKDELGRYIIELEGDCCYLEVEDTPFVIKAVYGPDSQSSDEECIHILLSDQSIEKLDPDTLRVGKDNVLYCSIKGNTFTARFSRASYYQIANFIKYDADKDKYLISLSGKSFYIKA